MNCHILELAEPNDSEIMLIIFPRRKKDVARWQFYSSNHDILSWLGPHTNFDNLTNNEKFSKQIKKNVILVQVPSNRLFHANPVQISLVTWLFFNYFERKQFYSPYPMPSLVHSVRIKRIDFEVDKRDKRRVQNRQSYCLHRNTVDKLL